MNRLVLILGGARSGKSALAQSRAEALGPKRLYVATAEAHDAEMADRIARHRAERGAGWRTLEAPRALPDTLRALPPDAADVVLIDCLTLWLSNLLLAESDLAAAERALFDALSAPLPPLILVSNEVGMGVVPPTPLGRAFRDAQGRLNQALARRCDEVVFVAAGLPLTLKSPPPPGDG